MATGRRGSRQAIHLDTAGRWHLEEAFGEGLGVYADGDITRRLILEADARAWYDRQQIPWPPTSATSDS